MLEADLLSVGDICKVISTGELVMRVVGLIHYSGHSNWKNHKYCFISVLDNAKNEYKLWGYEVEFIFNTSRHLATNIDKYNEVTKNDLKKKGQLSIFDEIDEDEEEDE